MIAALFCRSDSIYKSLGCDVYDLGRNALNYSKKTAVIAHPPCRAWGDLYKLAKPLPGEKDLAIWAVNLVRQNGGVVEHPKKSKLWGHMDCRAPGQIDEHGGFLLPIDQYWFGHRAEKKTYLYIVGLRPAEVPVFPMVMGRASHVVTQPGRRKGGVRKKKGDFGWRPEISKAEREHTPEVLAKWLVDLVNLIEARKAGLAA
jgi:hypothetical protein